MIGGDRGTWSSGGDFLGRLGQPKVWTAATKTGGAIALGAVGDVEALAWLYWMTTEDPVPAAPWSLCRWLQRSVPEGVNLTDGDGDSELEVLALVGGAVFQLHPSSGVAVELEVPCGIGTFEVGLGALAAGAGVEAALALQAQYGGYCRAPFDLVYG